MLSRPKFIAKPGLQVYELVQVENSWLSYFTQKMFGMDHSIWLSPRQFTPDGILWLYKNV